jgi:hypothetical protein
MICPASVIVKARVERTSKVIPRLFSSASICRTIAEGVTLRRRAGAEKLPVPRPVSVHRGRMGRNG